MSKYIQFNLKSFENRNGQFLNDNGDLVAEYYFNGSPTPSITYFFEDDKGAYKYISCKSNGITMFKFMPQNEEDYDMNGDCLFEYGIHHEFYYLYLWLEEEI